MEIQKQDCPSPVEVPAENLSEEVLVALVESFILREGTDYGQVEISLEKKIEAVKRQIQRQEVKIIFDFESESVTLLTKQEWAKKKSV